MNVISTCLSSGAAAVGQARFGAGADGPIVLDEVQCGGEEAYLINCSSSGLGLHNCLHTEDASVICLRELNQNKNSSKVGTIFKFMSVLKVGSFKFLCVYLKFSGSGQMCIFVVLGKITKWIAHLCTRILSKMDIAYEFSDECSNLVHLF